MNAADIWIDPKRLDNRGILKGVQCVCGQWWPDFVHTAHALQFRTECCGSLYHLQTGESAFSTLCLVEDGRDRPPEPEPAAAETPPV